MHVSTLSSLFYAIVLLDRLGLPYRSNSSRARSSERTPCPHQAKLVHRLYHVQDAGTCGNPLQAAPPATTPVSHPHFPTISHPLHTHARMLAFEERRSWFLESSTLQRFLSLISVLLFSLQTKSTASPWSTTRTDGLGAPIFIIP
jgi:hypothetical protein